jgi:hypothetical protein
MIKINEGIIADVLKLIEQGGPVTFRDLMIRLPDSIDAQDVWNSLKYLQKARIVEPIKISRKKMGYKIQYAHANINKICKEDD